MTAAAVIIPEVFVSVISDSSCIMRYFCTLFFTAFERFGGCSAACCMIVSADSAILIPKRNQGGLRFIPAENSFFCRFLRTV